MKIIYLDYMKFSRHVNFGIFMCTYSGLLTFAILQKFSILNPLNLAFLSRNNLYSLAVLFNMSFNKIKLLLIIKRIVSWTINKCNSCNIGLVISRGTDVFMSAKDTCVRWSPLIQGGLEILVEAKVRMKHL